MKRIELADFPRWSPWPGRLMNLTPWSIPTRTVDKVDREYDKDKYAACLAFLEGKASGASAEDVKRFEFGESGDAPICVSVGDELYETTLLDARRRYYDLLTTTLGPLIEKSRSVVELGAGYGYNLWMLKQRFADKTFFGGEYSENATKVAARLYGTNSGITVKRFNFYDAQTYEFLRDLPAPVVVYTAHAIEQIPHIGPLFDSLVRFRDRIEAVVHFEPLHEEPGTHLLQMLRHRYTEANDYNRDLLSELRSRSYVKLTSLEENVYGLNPLNPSSVFSWKFS
jgi:hypothetical protein